jgi:SPP1 gp7 family putative phage head morphogenesis protein
VPLLAEAIDHLIEANVAVRKRRALAKLERQLAAAMQRAFRAEERAFLTRLARLEPLFAPAVREAAEVVDWEPIFDEAALATLQAFAQPIDEFAARALEAGILAMIAELGLEVSFPLEHPAAVAYLREHGATQVARIRNTTRDTLRRILGQAAEEGWSYNRTAKAIRERYRNFSKERAKNIAVFELGDAYEHGNMLVARDLQVGGLEMQKSWLTVGDDRVRPDHRGNQAQGWIPLDDAFADGTNRPPTDPRCRCTLLMRRKPDE